jgi:hypothetical protein
MLPPPHPTPPALVFLRPPGPSDSSRFSIAPGDTSPIVVAPSHPEKGLRAQLGRRAQPDQLGRRTAKLALRRAFRALDVLTYESEHAAHYDRGRGILLPEANGDVALLGIG